MFNLLGSPGWGACVPHSGEGFLVEPTVHAAHLQEACCELPPPLFGSGPSRCHGLVQLDPATASCTVRAPRGGHGHTVPYGRC